ncbi:MAG: hypothetical protein GX802_03110 [Clostridiales bacterium]|nr:hypothetical protein [Clostridiales bacterium]
MEKQHEMPKSYDHSTVEDRLYKHWEGSGNSRSIFFLRKSSVFAVHRQKRLLLWGLCPQT